VRVTFHGASRTRAGAKTAICLCGGGITGALFEVGVLAGFADVLGEAAANAFDVYVGSSAGATVASVLSQGVKPERMFHALCDPADPFFPVRRADVYGPEPRSWMASLLRCRLPAGVFRLDRYVRFLCSFFARQGLSNDFRDLRRELYIVANDVDSAERVVFGSGLLRNVAIATAVAASSAIPVFFEPIRIGDRDYFDGGIGRVDHIDVAIAQGATRILVINPVVPVRVDANRLRSQGLLHIANQAMRIMSKARLRFGMKRQLGRHPHVQVMLIEPSQDEMLMFVAGAMSLAARGEILEYARDGARRALRQALERGPITPRFDQAA
jgi:NTE family protein